MLSSRPIPAKQYNIGDFRPAPHEEAIARGRAPTGKFTLSEADQWLRRATESHAEGSEKEAELWRHWIEGIQKDPLNAIDLEEEAGSDPTWLSLGRPVSLWGEPEELGDLGEEMVRTGLWGQERAEQAFKAAALDDLSPLRVTPPVLVLTGHPNTGQGIAVDAFNRIWRGDEAQPIRIDLAVPNPDTKFEEYFGEGGLLHASALKKEDDDESLHSKVVHLTGLDGLETRAPKIAAELARRIRTVLNSDEPRAIFIMEFQSPGEPPDKMIQTFGHEVADLVSASYQFEEIAPETAARFARLLIDKMLLESADHPWSMEKVTVHFDAAARDVLGRILATRSNPLQESLLRTRLLRLVLEPLHRRSVDTAGVASGLFHVRLAPGFKEDPTALEKLLTRLDTEDIRAGQQAFTMVKIAEHADLTPEQFSNLLDAIDERISGARVGLSMLCEALGERVEEAMGPLEEIKSSLSQLEDAFDEAMVSAQASVAARAYAVFSPSQRATLCSLIESVRNGFATIAALPNLNENAMGEAQASRDALDKAREGIDALAREVVSTKGAL